MICAYFTVGTGVHDHTEEIDDVINVDVDTEGKPTGLEILVPAMDLTPSSIEKLAQRFPGLQHVLYGASYRPEGS